MNKSPRFMIAAPSSGSGKTMLTCGLMRLFAEKKDMKCRDSNADRIILIPCFIPKCWESQVSIWILFLQRIRCCVICLTEECSRGYSEMSIAVLEGVMGYYDGLAGRSIKGSTCDIARITDTPVILCIDTKGMSLSVVPYVKGFLEYIPDSHIQGVILNRCSKGMYPILKELLETQLNIAVIEIYACSGRL